MHRTAIAAAFPLAALLLSSAGGCEENPGSQPFVMNLESGGQVIIQDGLDSIELPFKLLRNPPNAADVAETPELPFFADTLSSEASRRNTRCWLIESKVLGSGGNPMLPIPITDLATALIDADGDDRIDYRMDWGYISDSPVAFLIENISPSVSLGDLKLKLISDVANRRSSVTNHGAGVIPWPLPTRVRDLRGPDDLKATFPPGSQASLTAEEFRNKVRRAMTKQSKPW